MSVLQWMRIILHLGVILALTIRSTRVGNTLHPYQRGLANEWVHLLFFVETTTTVPTFDPQDPEMKIPVTLPNFLLESEEEIAANIEEENFATGFAARASSYPVGALFTIEETRKHLHGVVNNYLKLADVALNRFYIADEDGRSIPHPELTVWSSWDGDSLPHKYIVTGRTQSEWPGPLRFAYPNATATRLFFDQLDGMEVLLIIGVQQNDSTVHHPSEVFKWWVKFAYDLQSQGHLEVSMNFGLRPIQDSSPHSDKKDDVLQHKQIPSIFFERDTLFDWCLLGLIAAYQTVEFVLKWWNSQTAVALLSPRSDRSPRYYRERAWQTFLQEARDFWFWCILCVNVATTMCVFTAWYRSYRLILWDALCLTFAICCALQWISLVRYLSFNARFHILGLTLQRGLPRVAQFLVGVFPIFVGFVLFGTIMFGAKVPRFQSVGTTATTLFSVANGDEIHDTFNAVAFTPWIGQFYIYSYLILFSYVVLMVCIGIIEDAFFSAVFPASWPSLHKTEMEEAKHHAQSDET